MLTLKFWTLEFWNKFRSLRSLVFRLRGKAIFVLHRNDPIGTKRLLGIHGVKMSVDLGDPMGRLLYGYRGVYEEQDIKFLGANVRKGSVCIDVGANQGLYSIVMSRSVGESGRVIAFEPDPSQFHFLKENVQLNNCENVTMVCSAVGQELRIASLYSSKDSPGGGSLKKSNDMQIEVKTEMITLNSYIADNKLPRVDFLKIDVEGAELEVLKGADEVLVKYGPSVMLEINPQQLALFGASERQIREFMRSRGYEKPVDPGDISLRLFEDSEEIDKLCNLYFTPE